MLRLFRQLRKTLVEQQKLRTYLLYAIGEILLVVIGILIALQINNWNQERMDKKLEESYLKELKVEFEENVAFIESFYLDRYDRKVEALNMLREYYHGNYVIQDSAYFAIEAGFGAVFGTRTYQGSSPVFDEMISTGKLNVIKDELLRRKLIDYYRLIDIYMESLKEYSSGYLMMINSLRPFNENHPDHVDPDDMALIIKHAGTEAFYLSATGELTYANQTISFFEQIKVDAEQIVALIRTSLERDH